MPPHVKGALRLFRYQEKMRLSDKQIMYETNMRSVGFAFAVWNADAKRSKLEEERSKARSKANQS